MPLWVRGGLTAVILATMPRVAAAQTTQTVQYQVAAINVIAVAGSPTLVVAAAVPGSAPTPATSSGLTWAVTTNQSNAKITARINAAMPAGMSLTANLEAPTGGSLSTGTKTLTTTAQDMVTGLTRVAQGGMDIIYVFTAAVTVGPTSGTRTVTYTITGGV
jgi:hypothetical protein